MVDQTKINSLQYALRREGFSFVSKSNLHSCAKIASRSDNFSKYLTATRNIAADQRIFFAYLTAVNSNVLILSDTHPITSYIILFPPGTFSFSKIRFFFRCGGSVIFAYGLSYFRKYFAFISASEKTRRKYTGEYAWYITKFISGNHDKSAGMLTTLLNWLDAYGEVVFSDCLSENDAYFAAKHGFEVIHTKNISNINYFSLLRTPQK